MAAVILFGIIILIATQLVTTALWIALFTSRLKTVFRRAFLGLATVVACIAYWTTFHYVYFTNFNVRVHGWPVPIVVFQRADADSPWLDYVGYTTLWGYPINFVIFMAVPSLLVFVTMWRQGRIQAPTDRE